MRRRSKGEGTIFFVAGKGLWLAKLTLPDGKRKVKYAKTQKTVREWLVAQQNALRQGLLPQDDNITISDFLANYMETVGKQTLRPKTIEVYSYLIRLHIVPFIGRIKLSQLRPDHLQALYSQKQEAGLSRRTVQFMHAIIHKALDQAMRWGLTPRNVADLVKAPVPAKKQYRVLDASQVHLLLDSVAGHRYSLIYILSIYCGFREGEVLGIHVEDCDLVRGTINVRHAVQFLSGKGLVITEPKTDSSRRSVTLPATALKALAEHLANLNRNQGLIFTTSTGKPISARNVTRHFKEALQKVGLPPMRFHDLRHTSASLLLSAGVNPKVVQERLGHSQIGLTMDLYSHLLPGIQEKAAEDMERILG